MARINRAIQVQFQDLIPFIKVHFPEMLVGHDVRAGHLPARNVDEDVYMAVTVGDGIRDASQRGDVHNVTSVTGRVSPIRGKAFKGRSDLLLPMYQRDDFRSLRGEMTGKRTSENSGRASDDSDLISD